MAQQHESPIHSWRYSPRIKENAVFNDSATKSLLYMLYSPQYQAQLSAEPASAMTSFFAEKAESQVVIDSSQSLQPTT